jgi:hypothetical protein
MPDFADNAPTRLAIIAKQANLVAAVLGKGDGSA